MEATIGLTADQVKTSTEGPEFRLGQKGVLHSSAGTKEYMYVQATEAITAAGYLCVVKTGFTVEMADVTATTAGTVGFGSPAGAAQAAIASSGYGWIQIYGKGSLRTLASAAKGTRLNTTATAGAVDDDGTAGSEAIFGLVIGTATGGAEATNADAYFFYPVVGTTL
jgi:hypothetical protein